MYGLGVDGVFSDHPDVAWSVRDSMARRNATKLPWDDGLLTERPMAENHAS